MTRFGSERGAQLVEFALILPILLLVLGGIAEFGLMYHASEITTNAAREAARAAILPGVGASADAMAQARVADYLTSAGLRGTSTTTLTPAAVPLGNGLIANGIRVTVTYTYTCLLLGPIVSLVNGNFGDTVMLRSTTLMRTLTPAAAP